MNNAASIPVFFYIRPELMPADPDRYLKHPEFHMERTGVYNWTLQAFLGLRETGFGCVLTSSIPARGIIIAHRDCWPIDAKPGAEQLFVCIKPDRGPHPYAQVHIVQNRKDDIHRFRFLFGSVYFMNHFPQSNLSPRAPGRTVQNVAYMGTLHELDDCFKTETWKSDLKAIGLNWVLKPDDRWNDYSDIDILFAVRRLKSSHHLQKPASKLVNAWRAGTPAVLGAESAYQALRENELDYMEVSDRTGALRALESLKTNPDLYSKMAANGVKRAAGFTREAVIDSWRKLITENLYADYKSWVGSSPAAKWTRRLKGNAVFAVKALKDRMKKR